MVQIRKEPLATNYYYHIYTRSISKYIVFNNKEEYNRLYQLLYNYRFTDFKYKFSRFLELSDENQKEIQSNLEIRNDVLVEIVAFCIMPTHIHLVLKQTKENGITKFMSQVLNSYARYFNTKHQRIGPLWSGRFKSVLVDRDEQLLHLSRYIHLNPTSARLADEPEDWPDSSYKEYISEKHGNQLCKFESIIDINNEEYKKFTKDHKDYQRTLSIIKYLTIDNYSG